MRAALAIVAVSALSLLLFDQATYDPTAWLIWGRQIAEGTLDTVDGPTWKPLPVVFTTPFSLAGDAGAMSLWLFVARVGGLLSLLLAYRLAARLGGRGAGVIAVAALALAAEYQLNWLRGNSEGWLVALGLLAVLRHLDGCPRQAFACAAGAALIRPDVWPLFGLYGLWLLHRERDARTAALVLGTGGAVLAAWFVPEYVASGDLLRGVVRAQEVVPGTPGADRSFFAVFDNAKQSLSYGVYAGAVLSLVVAARDRRVAALAAGSVVLMIAVAFGATGPGFTGSLRYVTLPASLVCVLSGVGWMWLARRAPARPAVVLVVALAAAAPGLVGSLDRYERDVGQTQLTDRRLSDLPGFIERAGGREAILACGDLFTGPFSTQAVAYHMHVRQREVSYTPEPPGTIVDATGGALEGTSGFVRKLRESQWTLQSTC